MQQETLISDFRKKAMTSQIADVSVVIPVYNRPDLLEQVLECLSAQTYSTHRMEVLVCDDGSTDDLSPTLQKYSDRLPLMQHLRQTNKGPSAARNLGTANTSAPVLIYMDSDILPKPDVVAKLVESMKQNSDWAGAEAKIVPTGGEPNLLWDAPVCESGGVFLTAAIIYRTELLRQVGGFDESFHRAACEDVELAVRIMPFGKIGFVEDAVVEHPRRRRTFSYYWKKRSDWKYVTKLALRHGFMGWPGRDTNWPRLRVAFAAIISQPANRLITACRTFFRQPVVGLTIGLHAVFGSICGAVALPEVVTASNPAKCDFLKSHAVRHNTSRAA